MPSYNSSPDNRGGLQTPPPGTPDKRGAVLNTPPNNLPYGMRGQLERGLQAVPATPPGSPAPAGQPAPQYPAPPITPSDIPNLNDPTAYPSEPVTAGLSTGPGVGPDSLHLYNFGSEELSVLRGAYRKFPNDDLRRLIEWEEYNA